MIQLRPSSQRGFFDHGWLKTHHTFSFADYQDPAWMGFKTLRVINEDTVAPGKGFPTHGHRDMEILTYVLAGELEHKDSMGTGSRILPGEVQRMSAGTGVTHSEFNPSSEKTLHLLQIWILPGKNGIAPGYEQKKFPDELKEGKLCLVASPEGRAGSVTIHQDTDLYISLLKKGTKLVHPLKPGRHAWVQAARGIVEINGHRLVAGDGIALSDEKQVEITGQSPGEILLFDMP